MKIFGSNKVIGLITERDGYDEENKWRRNYLFEAIRPLAILGRLFGFFPIANLDSVAAGSKVSFGAYFLRVFNAVVVGIPMAYIYVYVGSNGNQFSKFLDMFGGACTKLVIVHCIFRVQALYAFLRKWESQISEDFLRPDLRCRLIVYGHKMAGLGAALFFFLNMWNGLDAWRMVLNVSSWPRPSVYTVVKSWELCALIYVQLIPAVVCHALASAFEELATRIGELLAEERRQGDAVNADRLRSLRETHEMLCQLTEAANRIYVPGIYAGFAASTCSSVMDTLYFLVMIPRIRNKFATSVFGYAVSAVLRQVTVYVHCHQAASMAKRAKSGLDHIYEASLLKMEPQSRFQLRLLESQMNDNDPTLSVFGVMTINNEMIMEILGFVSSYSVVALEMTHLNNGHRVVG